MADQVQAQGGNDGGEHAAAESVQHLGGEHGQLEGRDCQGDGCQHDGHERGSRRPPLVGHGVHEGAGGHLARDTGDGAQGEGQADFDLGPFVRCEVNRNERAESGLDVGHEEVEEIERAPAAPLGGGQSGPHRYGSFPGWADSALAAPEAGGAGLAGSSHGGVTTGAGLVSPL